MIIGTTIPDFICGEIWDKVTFFTTLKMYFLTFIKTKENKITLAGTWQGEDNYCSYVDHPATRPHCQPTIVLAFQVYKCNILIPIIQLMD